jgi:hypothetical protein
MIAFAMIGGEEICSGKLRPVRFRNVLLEISGHPQADYPRFDAPIST